MTDVLIVDDEPPVLDLLRDVLVGEGYSVAAASNGRAALQLLDDGLEPSLVITDLRMPELTGVELAAALRARLGRDAPPVALISANHQWLDNVEGVVAKLSRPFMVDAVIDLVDRHCGPAS